MKPFPILLIDGNGRIVRTNRAAESRFPSCVGRLCADVVGLFENGRVRVCTEDCATNLARQPGGGVREVRGRVGDRPSKLTCASFDGGVLVQVEPDPAVELLVRPLSGRERQVVRLVAQGLTGREIAEQLGLSTSTVRSHAEKAMERLGARNRAEMVARAVALGIATGFATTDGS